MGSRVIQLGSFTIVFWLCSAGITPEPEGQYHQPLQMAEHAVEIQMKNVNFRLARDIVLEVRTLRGQLQRTKLEIPVTLDDSDSFAVNVDAADIAITPTSLA